MARFRGMHLCLATMILGSGMLSAQNHSFAPFPSANSNEIPEGKTVLIRLGQRLETRDARPGQHFKASLAEDLIAQNGNMIPKGSAIRGHISRATQGVHPRLLLSFDGIQSQRGWEPLIASVTSVPGEHGVKDDDDGSIEAATHSSKSSSDSIDEPRSPWSRIGGVAGFFADKSVRLEKGAILEIRLDHAIQLARR
jgi:hypothetical protein